MEFVADHLDTYPVKWLCELVDLACSSFYAWRKAASTRAPVSPPDFSELIEAHKARTGVSAAELARRVGISRQHLHGWRTTELRALPARELLEQVAAVTEYPYEVVLTAALREAGYLPTQAAVFDDCLDPLLRTSAAQFARESLQLYELHSSTGPMPIGTGTVRVLSHLWRTTPPKVAYRFLADYLDVLRGTDPAISWSQVEDGLFVEFSGLLTAAERDHFLTSAHDYLAHVIAKMPGGDGNGSSVPVHDE